MNTKITNIAFVGGLLLGGCTLSEDQIEIESVEDLDDASGPLANPADEIASENHNQTSPVAGNLIPAECIGAPVVGILDNPSGSCQLRSLPPNWIWRPMFEDGSPEVAALQDPVPQEFQRFCMYEYVGQQDMKSLEDYNAILTEIDNHPDMTLDSVAADCMGFKEQSTLNDVDLRKLLNEAFLLNIDAVDSSDLAATLPYQTPVRVEVVDSVSQYAVDNGLAPHNAHGMFMSALIGNIACPNGGGACLDSIHHLLAMPREDYQYPDWAKGKDYASKVDLAIQIYAAVQQWREDKYNHAPNATDRLVINISLGYQRVNQGVDDFDRGPQASLKTALDFAACHGALVFAASGNVRDENCPQNDVGPLAPASFETIAAPTEQECHALGFDPDWAQDFPVFGEPRPLVYAMGGVDPYDEPLANSRPGSQPALVATGANAVGNDSSMALTGTSISTAVGAATGQMLWMHNPRMTPDEVYFAMYKSAWDLNTVADFGFFPGATTRRISVCAALNYVCEELNSPSTCPILNCEAQAPAADGNLGGFFAAVEDVLHDPNNVIEEFDGQQDSPVCSAAPVTELVLPNPEMPVCGHCGADIVTGLNNDTLYMSIDPSYQGQIQGAVLLVKNMFGNTIPITIDPAAIGSLNNPSVSVVKVNFSAPSYTKSATLNFTLSSNTQSNPVILKFINN
jgi:hypothetical protein